MFPGFTTIIMILGNDTRSPSLFVLLDRPIGPIQKTLHRILWYKVMGLETGKVIVDSEVLVAGS